LPIKLTNSNNDSITSRQFSSSNHISHGHNSFTPEGVTRPLSTTVVHVAEAYVVPSFQTITTTTKTLLNSQGVGSGNQHKTTSFLGSRILLNHVDRKEENSSSEAADALLTDRIHCNNQLQRAKPSSTTTDLNHHNNIDYLVSAVSNLNCATSAVAETSSSVSISNNTLNYDKE
jgi:hypothetical protein